MGHADYDTRSPDAPWQRSGRPKVWDYDRHSDIGPTQNDGSTADTPAETFCNMMKTPDRNIQIFTVAFEAPYAGEHIMKTCACTDAHSYDVSGLNIVAAFKSIASQINQPKLIQ